LDQRKLSYLHRFPHNYTYDAFGETESHAGATENSYLFAGEQLDANLGQYYLRQRYYNQEIGRFNRQDIYEAGKGDLSNLNKYVYAGNNPLINVDPIGLYLGNIQEVTVTEKMRSDLEAAYRLPTVTRTYAVARTNMLVIAAALAGATVIAVSTARSLNQLLGVPIVFWGDDVREVTEHQFKAVTGSGYTRYNTSGTTGLSIPISPALHRFETGHPRKWMYKQPQSAGRSKSLGLDTDELPYAATLEGGEGNYERGLGRCIMEG
jgi:RHS repeat-associated protein